MNITLSIQCDCRSFALSIPVERDIREGDYPIMEAINNTQDYFRARVSNPYGMYLRCTCGKVIEITY